MGILLAILQGRNGRYISCQDQVDRSEKCAAEILVLDSPLKRELYRCLSVAGTVKFVTPIFFS